MLLINNKQREAYNNSNKSLIIHKVQLLFLKIILVLDLNDNYAILKTIKYF